MRCELPSDTVGYCIECDKFWSLPPKHQCPEHGIKLSQHKTAMSLLRLGNDIFDMVCLRILAYPVFFLLGVCLVYFGRVDPDLFNNIDPFAELTLTAAYVFLYYFVFESICQRTPGKFITGTKVVTFDGTKPSLGSIASRTLVRFVPFDAFSFLGGRVLGWHDRWSGTYVIKAKRFGKATSHEYQPSVASDYSDNQSESSTTVDVEIQPQEEFIEESPAEIPPEPMMLHRLEKCANCERVIGKLEHSHKFRGSVVCVQCYRRLEPDVSIEDGGRV